MRTVFWINAPKSTIVLKYQAEDIQENKIVKNIGAVWRQQDNASGVCMIINNFADRGVTVRFEAQKFLENDQRPVPDRR